MIRHRKQSNENESVDPDHLASEEACGERQLATESVDVRAQGRESDA
jgi:hypothetical protein